MWSYLLAHEGKQVEVDSCGHCYGLWLDANEAEMLHAITAETTAEQMRPGASRGGLAMGLLYLVQLATFIPIEVYNPVKRKPVLVYSLLVANIALYVFEMFLIGTKQIEPFLHMFGAIPDEILHGREPWALLTHAFLHGSIPHVLGNMYYLWIFGDNVEDRLGRGRFTILYLASAVIACMAHVLGNVGSPEVMVGASGAIAGLMGAYFILFPRVKVWVVLFFFPLKIRAIWYLLIWIGMQFLIMLDDKSNVAWLAHVGGFIGGMVLALLLKPKDAAPPQAYPARA